MGIRPICHNGSNADLLSSSSSQKRCAAKGLGRGHNLPPSSFLQLSYTTTFTQLVLPNEDVLDVSDQRHVLAYVEIHTFLTRARIRARAHNSLAPLRERECSLSLPLTQVVPDRAACIPNSTNHTSLTAQITHPHTHRTRTTRLEHKLENSVHFGSVVARLSPITNECRSVGPL
jgi:hypothetical protein